MYLEKIISLHWNPHYDDKMDHFLQSWSKRTWFIGGSKGVPGTCAPLWLQILTFSCSFREKFGQIIGLYPILEVDINRKYILSTTFGRVSITTHHTESSSNINSIFATSSEDVTITRHGVFLVTTTLLDFVKIHWESFRENSIEIDKFTKPSWLSIYVLPEEQ